MFSILRPFSQLRPFVDASNEMWRDRLPTRGLVTNLDTQNVASLTLVDGAASQIDDLSGAGNHGTQTVADSRPRYNTRRNEVAGSAALATQDVMVTAAERTLSFRGAGTVTLSGVSTAGPLVGTGANDFVSLTFTPSAGTLTLTVSGTVEEAQLELGSARSAYQSVNADASVIIEVEDPTRSHLYFDGSNDFLELQNAAPAEETTIIVARLVGAPSNDIFYGTFGANRNYIGYRGDATLGMGLGADSYADLYTTVLADEAVHIYALQTASDLRARLFFDGVNLIDEVASGGEKILDAPYIGSVAGANATKVNINQVVQYNRFLTQRELTAADNALAAKWGISL